MSVLPLCDCELRHHPGIFVLQDVAVGHVGRVRDRARGKLNRISLKPPSEIGAMSFQPAR